MRLTITLCMLIAFPVFSVWAADAPTKWNRTNIPEGITQYDDGVIVFPLQSSRLEKQATDNVSENWTFKATRWGRYEAILITSGVTRKCDVKLMIGSHKLAKTISEPLFPGRAGRLRYEIPLGNVYLAKAGPFDTKITTTNKFKPRLLVLKPTAEGKPVEQNTESGEVVLHSRDATVIGTILRFEPKPEKNTLGYWINAKDRAYWEFEVKQPGSFQVEILQGCGKGQGGSEIYLELKPVGKQAEKQKPQQLPWTVIDTGHFQNFKPYDLGTFQLKQKGAKYRLTVHVKNKKHKAVMDLRHVILRPVSK